MVISRNLRHATIVFGLLTGGGAQAADLANDSYYQNTVSPAVYNWTGAYVGGHLGYGWGETGTNDMSGWTGGVQGGYNIQTGGFVFGVEADLGVAGISGDNGGISTEIDALGSIRGRAGVTFDQFLLYGTGGFSFASITATNGGNSDDVWTAGWVIGVGAEAILTANWTARIEAFYYDLGRDTFNLGVPTSLDSDVTVLRAAFNYRF
jgi:outer membrane immunogenic protein